jgi:hypothetical protein
MGSLYGSKGPTLCCTERKIKICIWLKKNSKRIRARACEYNCQWVRPCNLVKTLDATFCIHAFFSSAPACISEILPRRISTSGLRKKIDVKLFMNFSKMPFFQFAPAHPIQLIEIPRNRFIYVQSRRKQIKLSFFKYRREKVVYLL